MRAWLAVCLLAGAGSLAAWSLPPVWLDWQPALLWPQPWRLVSAAWVHWNALHLLTNLAALVLLAVAGWRVPMQGRDAMAWLLAWPLTHLLLALLAPPGLLHYGGLSGLLHGAVVLIGLRLVANGQRMGWIWLGLLAVKLLIEQPWHPLLPDDLLLGLAVVPAAHLAGALAGLLALTGVTAVQPRRAAPRQ
ncbi:MAG: rhombosortase [Proteobacteria bacterium]|nr:rhombosortase [Pseudomonadota bacterium]